MRAYFKLYLMLVTVGMPYAAYSGHPGAGGFDPAFYAPPPGAEIDDRREDIAPIIARLNERFGARWSFKILSHQLYEDVAVVMGELTAGGVTKQQFGSADRKKSAGDMNGLSTGEALKAATTEAFKNAALFFGVGLEQHFTSASGANEQGNLPDQIPADGADLASASIASGSEDIRSDAPPPTVAAPPASVAVGPNAWFDPKNTRFVGTDMKPPVIDTRQIVFSRYLLKADRITAPLRMDGLLDDPAWRQAVAAAGFRQLWPSEGHLDTERTEVRALFDESTLYFGVMCYDSKPDRVVATEMRRDQNVDDDDNFEMTIAPYGDKGDSYYFITNPLGSRRDALVGAGLSSFNADWNATWACYGKRHSMGWSLEIAIPFRNFRFDPETTQEWAVNFGRHVKRTRTAAFWVPLSRAGGGIAGLYRYDRGGRLAGLEGIKPGRALEVFPYSVLGSLGSRRISAGNEKLRYDFKREFGGDLKWGITSGITADATVNPDFAQISADDQIVNLTRFEFRFNEKRPFFLEGAGIFQFGGFFTGPQIFFSRRIGAQLFDGSTVPILHGEKISGKIGSASFGLLNVHTRETPWIFTSTRVETLSDTAYLPDGALQVTHRDTLSISRFPQIEPETNWNVFRIKQNLFSRSSIGLLATFKEPEDVPDSRMKLPGFRLSRTHYNRVVGLDVQLQFDRSRHEINLIAAKSWTPENRVRSQALAGGDSTLLGQKAIDWAGTLSHSWQNAWFGMRSTYTDIRAGFIADMGFVPRRDIRQANASIGVFPLLQRWGIRSIGSSGGGFGSLISGAWTTRHKGNFFSADLVESWNTGVSPGIEFENGTYVDFEWTREFDRLTGPTSIAGVDFPAGGHTFDSFGGGIFTDRGKPVSLRGFYSQGKFYDAKRRTLQAALTLKPTHRARITLETTYNRLNRAPGVAGTSHYHETFIPRLRTNLSFSTDLFVSIITQMNADRTSSADPWRLRNITSNFLLAYTMQKGHTFLLAYNAFADDDFTLNGRQRLRTASQTIVAKVSYLFML